MSSSTSYSDEHPSMLWVVIPPVLLAAGYFARKWWLGYKLKHYGIGKGAPGFQTNVRRVRVTPEIAARIRRGEDVSPEEIAAASAKADEDERNGGETGSVGRSSGMGLPLKPIEERNDVGSVTTTPPSEVNEWLPDSITQKRKRGGGKRK